MRSLRDRGHGAFNYIFAKLDAEDLPEFEESDLYVGFEASPEGPRGVNLLKLMCGMRGVALAPDAVMMAERVDADANQAMSEIRGAIEAGNAAKLVAIGTSAQAGVLSSPAPILTAAQGLIRLGKYDDAREVLKHALAHFPKSVRARQLEGLSLRRLERYQEAIDVLSQLKEAGHQDPETLGMLGAAWDGLYQQSGKKLHLRNPLRGERRERRAAPLPRLALDLLQPASARCWQSTRSLERHPALRGIFARPTGGPR